MTKPLFSGLSETIENWGKGLHKWLGITSGSLKDIPGNHIRVGTMFLGRGESEEALRRGKLAAWMRKDSAEAWGLIVRAHAALGDKKSAEEAYNKASQLKYNNMQELQAAINDIGKEKPQETKEETAAEERAVENA